MIRAKMRVTEKADRIGWNADGKPRCTVKLTPVTDGGNKTWAEYTPAGSIELQIDNPSAYGAFKLGQHYFVDFTEAPATEAEEHH